MILQVLLIQILTFIGIVLVLRGLLYRHARQALDRLKSLHEETLEKEEILKEKVEITKVMHEEEIKKAKQEAESLIEQTKKEAQAKAQQIITSAEEDAEKIIEKSALQLERFKKEVLSSLGKKIALWTQQSIEDVLSPYTKDIIHQSLADEVIEELKKGEGELVKEGEDIEKIEVFSAVSLLQSQKDKVNDVFSRYLEKGRELDFNIDESLIGGLIININNRIIDGSLKNRIGQTVKAIVDS